MSHLEEQPSLYLDFEAEQREEMDHREDKEQKILIAEAELKAKESLTVELKPELPEAQQPETGEPEASVTKTFKLLLSMAPYASPQTMVNPSGLELIRSLSKSTSQVVTKNFNAENVPREFLIVNSNQNPNNKEVKSPPKEANASENNGQLKHANSLNLAEDIRLKLGQNIREVMIKKKLDLISTYEDEINKKEDKYEKMELFRQFTLDNQRMEQEGLAFKIKKPKVDTRALALERMKQLHLKRQQAVQNTSPPRKLSIF